MIPKLSGSGSSFSGLVMYFTHDPKATTNERVAWTHTHNLANDHVPSAVNEMYLTAENAELLKQQAGVRGGGQSTRNPAKHISLNWAVEDNPSQQHMIATAEHFLRHMGWHEHQAIFVAHSDKPYKHVHIILNEVHPETGLKLNDAYEKVRAQAWAGAYEREQGVIRCEQRTFNPEDRQKAMPRNMWMAFKQNELEFLKSEEMLRKNAVNSEFGPDDRKKGEWTILKDIQRDEREQFFADGKLKFKELRTAIYRENREEFRERWSDYFRAEKKGTEADKKIRADVKKQLMIDQKAALEPRRDAACADLKEARKLEYRELLDGQKEVRREFGQRLETGIDNADFFHSLAMKRTTQGDMALAFREASLEVTGNNQAVQARSFDGAEVEHGEEKVAPSGGRRDIADIGRRRVVASVGAFLDSLFMNLTGASAQREPTEEERTDQFREAAENALKQHQHRERESEDERWRERQRSFGE